MQDPAGNEMKMSPDSLYREETFTDRQMGIIKVLTPVNSQGENDNSREVIYTGETQIMLGNNPLPINFELKANSLGEAAELFAEEAHKAAEDTIKRLEEMRREMQNQIVVPGQEGGMGGMPGGGGIHIP